MDDESGEDDRDEMTNEEVSWDMTGEADGMNQGVDSRDGMMHSDLWFSMRRWLVGEKEWQQMWRGLNRDKIVKIVKIVS